MPHVSPMPSPLTAQIRALPCRALTRLALGAILFAMAVALLAQPAQAQGRDSLHARALAAVEAAEQADFASGPALRRTMVDVAAALKALRFSEAEAREGGKAEPPDFAGLRPGEVAGPDIADRRPGDRRVPLADVPDAWFAYHQDRAEAALVTLLTALDQGQGTGGEGRRQLAVIATHLDAMLRPPPGL